MIPNNTLPICGATEEHFPRIAEIFKKVVSTGDSYVFLPNAGDEEARAYWLS